ncbi:MAG: CheY-like chemotaxis protein [Sulfurimonas sp.]|jgi:CheY-like chemotaxis protein|uniref:response regulator transcription factor n=1 Tax=Sulfurimonas sp. TaxID=2022749 RepID=UPI0039E4C3FE
MKILIVDDIVDNRTTIELLLEEFEDIETSQAKSGQEAIDMCKKEHFDLIFMDIMMPNVDGITATKTIKSFDSNVMILALSALDDEESKHKMLESGAEDYMSKPIEDDLFHQRVKNYLQIVEVRKFELSNLEAVNEFSQEIYSRSLKFNISSIQSLSQFWDYYLNDSSCDIENLEECIRMIYAYGQVSLKKNINFSIISEENEENLYLTLTPLNIIDELVIQHTLLHHYANAIFILNNSKLSFRLSKRKKIIKEEVEKLDITDTQKDILSKTHFNKTTAQQYIDNTAISLIDKIEELENIEDMIQVATISFESEATQEYLNQMTQGLDTYIEVIDQLMEFEHFAFGLNTLNEYLKTLDLEQVDAKDHKKFSMLFVLLIDDMSQWRNNIFIKQEANDVHYLDSSLLSSCLQLQSIFEKKEVVQDDEDDFELF